MFAIRSALRRATTLGAVAATVSTIAVGALGTTGAGAVTPTAPDAPTEAAASGGYHSVEMTWVVGANNGDPITSFIVSGYLSGTLTSAVNVPVGAVGSNLDPTPGAHDFFVASGTQDVYKYSFTVAAVSAAGIGAASNISGMANGQTSPIIPWPAYNVSATARTSGVTVTWNVPVNNGSPITSFAIIPWAGNAAQSITTVAAEAPGSALSPVAGATDSTTIKGLTTGTSFTFSVRANNGIGAGVPSQLSNAVTDIEPAVTTLSASVTSLDFGDTTIGDYGDDQKVTFTNTGNTPANITGFDYIGPAFDDFIEDSSETQCDGTTLATGATCTESLVFFPGALGTRVSSITPIDGAANNPTVSLTGTGSEGYYEVTASGKVDVFGDAIFRGDLSGQPLPAPIVNIASTGNDGGYWLFDALGNVYNFGYATYYGDLSSVRLNKPIVGMVPTGDDGGYWLVASDGGIFTFGDAGYFGSTGGLRLNKPIVGMAATPDDGGYWLVASDGGIFAFGDAPYYGSTGNIRLNKPVVGMGATPDGGGYWLVASDGGIFSFGDASFHGSTGALNLIRPIVGMTVTPDGQGYWLDASDGGIFAFGTAPFDGSDGGKGVTNSAGIATDGFPTNQAFYDIPAARIHAHRES